MTKPVVITPEAHEDREHHLTMNVFAISAGMVGVCLTAIGILRLVASQSEVQSIGDELLAIDAVIFVVCTILSFWSFKTGDRNRQRILRMAVDVIFMLALVGMVGVCAIIAYALA